MPGHSSESHSNPGVRGLDPYPLVTRGENLFVVLLMAAATTLAIPALGQHLWFDEIITLLRNVRLPAIEIITRYDGLNNHVLYSLSAHFTTKLFGESAWSLRLPALVFGIASIPALYYLARQIASRHVAILASVFLTFNYFFLWFSTNARGYTGVMLGGLLSTILFIRILSAKRASAGLLTTYAIVAALTTWVQLTGLAVVLGHGLTWLLISTGPILRGNWAQPLRQLAALIGSVLLTMLLLTPIISSIISVFRQRLYDPAQTAAGAVGNSDAAVAVASKITKLGWTLAHFINEGIGQLVPGAMIASLLILVIMLAGIIASWRKGRAVFGLLLFPVLVSVLAGIFAMDFFLPRFIFVAIPCLLLLGVMGGFQLARWVLPFLSVRQVLVAGLVIAAITAIKVPDVWKPKQNFDAAVAFINAQNDESVALVCAGNFRPELIEYYGANCTYAQTEDALVALEEQYDEVIVVYALIKSARMYQVGQYLKSSYVVEQVFPGTLFRGQVTVARKRN